MPAGIYRVRNINNGRIYIGETIDLERRWQYHIIRLRLRTHKSKLLQHDFNEWLMYAMLKPMQFPFVFEIMLECEVSQLARLEELFIAALQPAYNTFKFKAKRKELDAKMIARIKERYGTTGSGTK